MRINKYLAAGSNLSRRAADQAIADGRVLVNGTPPSSGQDITEADSVTLDGRAITPAVNTITIMLNKPVGYVVSRNGQGAPTIYDLLPPELQPLQPVGRLDKDSSGLLLLTNNGQLAQELTHPSRQKQKMYEVTLDKPLVPEHWQQLTKEGVSLDDGTSKFNELRWIDKNDGLRWLVVMHEGRNRQIRRTFKKLGYNINKLHRTRFGNYILQDLANNAYRRVDGTGTPTS